MAIAGEHEKHATTVWRLPLVTGMAGDESIQWTSAWREGERKTATHNISLKFVILMYSSILSIPLQPGWLVLTFKI